MSDFLQKIEEQLALPEQRRQVSRRRWVVWLLLGPLTLAAAAEIGLRLAGYRRPQLPWRVQSATMAEAAGRLADRFGSDAFQPDSYLFWRLDSQSNLAGLPIAEPGLIRARAGHEQATTCTVLVLGDSVPVYEYQTFPEIAQRLLDAGVPRLGLVVRNASVPGYSSEQVLRWLPWVRDLQPRVVVLCVGWNDLFPALNLPDRELGARNLLMQFAHQAFYRLRLYQWFAAPDGERRAPDGSGGIQRVDRESFAANLRTFADRVASWGAVPVVVTQPHALTPETLKSLVASGFAGTPQELMDLRNEYNAVIRQVALDGKAVLLDLDEEFGRRQKPALFQPDGIHLAGPGHNLAARLLVGMMRNLGVLATEEFDAVVRAARFDTTAPDKPLAAWILNPPAIEAATSETVRVGVLAKNTGNTTWLRYHRVRELGRERDVPYGSTSIVGHWRSEGAETTGPAARTRLAFDLLPGESTSTTLEFRAPATPGLYAMEIGVEADHLGLLRYYGADVTTLTLTVR